jgi:transcriptional regulator with XRE-family HTH domain
MTQEDLAKAIGKTRSLVSHFERSGSINKYTLKEIADALGTDVHTLETTGNTNPDFYLGDKEVKINPLDKKGKTDNQQEIKRLKEEIAFLKDTIDHQWKVIHELSGKKKLK